MQRFDASARYFLNKINVQHKVFQYKFDKFTSNTFMNTTWENHCTIKCLASFLFRGLCSAIMSAPNKGKAVVQPSWLSTGESSGGYNGNGNDSQSVQSVSGTTITQNTKSEPVQVKSQGFKPKFVPKVPVKKEVAPAAAPSARCVFY